MNVLICEDDIITLRALDYSLKKEGYSTIRAEDGKVGYDMLVQHTNDIDMMITDQHMPYYSGLELVHLVRNELRLKFPIIMLTRVSLDATKQLALSLGVTEYITKPFLPRQLMTRVRVILEQNSNHNHEL